MADHFHLYSCKPAGRAGRAWRAAAAGLALAVALTLGAGGAAAQKQKKSKQQQQQQDPTADPINFLPDPQAIDMMVSRMLAAWQVGDVEEMHKYYVDDVAVVSAAWEIPVIGWDNYAKAYKMQWSRTQGARMDRINTFTKVTGDTAWTTYQWKFTGQVDGQTTTAVGHTTLVLQKRNGSWIILMNHSSESPMPAGTVTSAPAGIMVDPRISSSSAARP